MPLYVVFSESDWDIHNALIRSSLVIEARRGHSNSKGMRSLWALQMCTRMLNASAAQCHLGNAFVDDFKVQTHAARVRYACELRVICVQHACNSHAKRICILSCV